MENNYSGQDAFISSGNLKDESMKKPTMAQVGLLYSIGVVLLLFVGFRVQRQALYPGLLITEFILVLIPSLVLLRIYKYDVRRVLRLNRVSILNLFLILLIMIFSIPAVGIFNLVNLMMIKQVFGKVLLPSIPPSANLKELIVNVLIIAGSAGLCEEVMFRGVIQRGYERLGATRSILITAFLFGLFHLDFQRLLGTFMLGALIGFIVYRTNSLYSGMFAHFVNNSIAVVLPFLANKLGEMMNISSGQEAANVPDVNAYFADLLSMPAGQLVTVFIVWFFMLASCVAVLIGLMIAFVRTTSEEAENISAQTNSIKKSGILSLLPGFLLILLMYTAIGFSLKGVESGLAGFLYMILGIKL